MPCVPAILLLCCVLAGPGEHLFPGSGGGSSGGGVLAWAAGAGVQRPRLLICGAEGAGQSHLGPAVLYALEGLPVHAIGLPSLLSDAGARCGGLPAAQQRQPHQLPRRG